jgi:hypothetical protein
MHKIFFSKIYDILQGDALEKGQLNEAIENCVVIPLITLIGLYLIASAIDPLLQLNNQTFRITFTIAGGIPSLTLFFKKKIENRKPSELNEE